MFQYIFDYNYGNFLKIDFDNVSTVGNRNEVHSTKQVQTVSLQPDYVSNPLGKTKNSTKTANCLLLYVLLNRSFQTFAKIVQYSMTFLFVRKFFQQYSDTKIVTFLWGFIKNLCFLNLMSLTLSCELKLNCREL